MTQVGKFLTLLVVAAIILALITHPAGTAGTMAVGGSVLANVLSVESGANVPAGTKGGVSYQGASVSFA